MVKTKDIPQSRTQKTAGDLLLESLSNSDRDGYENVTFKKSEFALLKICRAYSISFNSSNVGKFFGVESWRPVSKFSKRKFLSSVPVLDKTWNRCSRATTAKKYTKKRDARA